VERELTYELTDDLMLRSYASQVGLVNFLWSIFVLGIFVASILWVLFSMKILTASAVEATALILAVLFTGYYWYGYCQACNQIRKQLASLPHRTSKIRVGNDEVHFEGSLGGTHFPWRMLQRIDCLPHAWHLQFMNNRHLFPIECLDEELAQFLRERAREQGVKVFRGNRDLTDHEGPLL